MEYFDSMATAGLCRTLIAITPSQSTYIETHPGGGAILKRRPPALRNIGTDHDTQVLSGFSCGHAVELAHGCCHRFLSASPVLCDGAGMQRSPVSSTHAQVGAPLRA